MVAHASPSVRAVTDCMSTATGLVSGLLSLSTVAIVLHPISCVLQKVVAALEDII